jgi:hypothetical protein
VGFTLKCDEGKLEAKQSKAKQSKAKQSKAKQSKAKAKPRTWQWPCTKMHPGPSTLQELQEQYKAQRT